MIRTIFLSLLGIFLFSMPVLAQEVPVEDEQVTAYESREVVGTVRSVGTTGILSVAGDDGTTYTVDPSQGNEDGFKFDINAGDRVILSAVDNLDGTETLYFVDMVRTKGLWGILLIFAVMTLIIGLRRGLFALVGFAATIAMLFLVIFPRILAGADPVLTVVLGGIVILAVNLFLAHGMTRNAVVAFASTSIGVVMAWLFSILFVAMAKLSGLGDEQAVFLYWDIGGLHAPVGLLLAGIILGTVGVLDDVAITQCETVSELRAVNSNLSRRELFMRGMRIGRHHIASTVNTLVLAYAGSAMPLLLIFLTNNDVSLWRFLNTEVVTQEIVRTLAGTTALMLVVPIATFLAAYAWSRASSAEARHELRHEQE